MAEEELSRKQNYLCKHIIDEGYQPQDFADYCLEVIGNVDMEAWTFEDLEKIVVEFVKSRTNLHEKTFVDYVNQPEQPAPVEEPPSRPKEQPRPAIQQHTIIVPPASTYVPQIQQPIHVPPLNTLPHRVQPAPLQRQKSVSTHQNNPAPASKNFQDIFNNPFSKGKPPANLPALATTSSTWDWKSPINSHSNSPAQTPSNHNKPNQTQFNFIDVFQIPGSAPITNTSPTTAPKPQHTNTKPVNSGNNFDHIFNQFNLPVNPPVIIQPPAATNSHKNGVNTSTSASPQTAKKTPTVATQVSTTPANYRAESPASRAGVQPQHNFNTGNNNSANFAIFELDVNQMKEARQGAKTTREQLNNTKPEQTPTFSPQPPKKAEQQKQQPSSILNKSQQMTRPPAKSQFLVVPHSQVQNRSHSRSQVRNKIKYEGNKVIGEDHVDIVKCAKAAQRTVLNKPGVSFQIIGHEIVTRNFFVPDYVLYHIKMKGLNISIKRKYNHFERLRNLLNKFYPCYRLSSLQKNTWLSETDPENIKRQKVMIEYFMNDLLMNKEFRNSRMVEQFLTIQDYKTLKSKLTEYQKIMKPKGLEELCLISGQVPVAYTQQQRIYNQKLGVYLTSMEGSFQKYRRLLDQLTKDQAAMLKTYTDISDLLEHVQSTTKIFNSSVQIFQFYQFQKTVNRLGEMYKQLSEFVSFQSKLIQSKLKPFLKFQGDNMSTLWELINRRNYLVDSYQRIPPAANKKEEYLAPSLAQFKQSLEDASRNPTVLKYQCGFYCHAVSSQTQRLFNDMTVKFNDKIIELTSDTEFKRVQQLKTWKQILSDIQSPT